MPTQKWGARTVGCSRSLVRCEWEVRNSLRLLIFSLLPHVCRPFYFPKLASSNRMCSAPFVLCTSSITSADIYACSITTFSSPNNKRASSLSYDCLPLSFLNNALARSFISRKALLRDIKRRGLEVRFFFSSFVRASFVIAG